MKNTSLAPRLLAAALVCAAASCHPNRPDAPATQHIYVGTSYNKTYGFRSNCRLKLNTYQGHSYIDGTWDVWGSSKLLRNDGNNEIEGYKKGSSIVFVSVPSALNRGVASAFEGKNAENVVDTIDRTNKYMGSGGMKFTSRLSGSTLTGSWVGELSATDRQKHPGVIPTQYGTFSMKRQ